ncbi:SDR family oxidoreductase [Dermatobacter hominis]|uniref:SDR family oxidoreductase n=1 Tax=Dermatobacter hominis TaxID=2884263 RepID=UPI001D10C94A|nr:SDR family oxidoreductase [Dermatobacter hominis]UDY37496.1 SDR family oxidoreductase [Dermatobacter hominis]
MTSERQPELHLVTGGSSGLGAAVAQRLDDRGDRVLVLDRKPPETDLPWIEVDLADPASVDAAMLDVLDRTEHLDGVVYAAGVDACGELEDVDGTSWDRVVGVNLLGAARVVRHALPALRERNGIVVTVASTLALKSLPAATAYCASKAGVLAFTRALAAEEQGRTRVTCIIPGGMATSFFDGRPERFAPGPDAVLNDPSDVAAAIVFAMDQPPGCEVRELVICPSVEPSWP